ncbi:MAG: hypothetical protein Fur0020_06920 [Thermodesulfovibrionia bacterium]
MKKGEIMRLSLFITLILFLSLTTSILAKEKEEDKNRIGSVVEIKGKGVIEREGKELDAEKEKDIMLNDASKTGDISLLSIRLIDDTLIILDEKSRLLFNEYTRGDLKMRGDSILLLEHGMARLKTCNNRVKVHTPMADAVAVYRSSDFSVWEAIKDGRRTFCLAVLKDPIKKIAIVDFENEKGSVRVPEGYMACLDKDGKPEEPYLIPNDIYNKLLELKGTVEWECRQRCIEGEDLVNGECVERCSECERLNPQGVCIPDNCKPCDDKDPCTVDDHCVGRKCKGKKVPSPVDPRCKE